MRLSFARRHADATPRIVGGLALPRRKPGLEHPILEVPLPPRLVLPLLGHRARPLTTRVRPGQRVRAGEPIADGLVASASGRVLAIEPHAVLHPSGAEADCVLIEPSEPSETSETGETGETGETPDPGREREPDGTRLDAAGIAGFGGAGYPLAAKLAAVGAAGGCRRLIVNACECEPDIACDEALLQADADGVVRAIEALHRAIGAEDVVIAIEGDKRAALAALQTALAVRDGAPRVLRLEPVYPSGAERPLVDLVARLAGETPLGPHERASDRGTLCLNVATVHAAGEALAGRAVTSRIVTLRTDLTGVPTDGTTTPIGRNLHVTFGTPIAHVLASLGITVDKGTGLRIGGPFSGFTSSAFAAPVTTTTHAVALIRTPVRAATSMAAHPCIRCGDCAPVCPVNLQPQLLHWQALADDRAGLRALGLERCLECGCCDAVCPSRLPLSATFAAARATLADDARSVAEAQRADALHRRREARLQALDARLDGERVALAAADLAVTPPTTAGTTATTSSDTAAARRVARDATVAAALERAKATARARARAAAPADAPRDPDGTDA